MWALVAAVAATAAPQLAYLDGWGLVTGAPGHICNASDGWATGNDGGLPNPRTLTLPAGQTSYGGFAEVWQLQYNLIVGRLVTYPNTSLYVYVEPASSAFGSVVQVSVTVCDHAVPSTTTPPPTAQLFRRCGPDLLHLEIPNVGCNEAAYGTNVMCQCGSTQIQSDNTSCTLTCTTAGETCTGAWYHHASSTLSPIAAPTVVPTAAPATTTAATSTTTMPAPTPFRHPELAGCNTIVSGSSFEGSTAPELLQTDRCEYALGPGWCNAETSEFWEVGNWESVYTDTTVPWDPEATYLDAAAHQQ